VEEADVLVSARKFAQLSIGITVPLTPLETFTLHLFEEILEHFDLR
jgi:hypothetical protein